MPNIVWIDFGRCFWIPVAVNPGKDVSQLSLIARISVVTTCAPNVAWCHACRCHADLCWYTLLAVCFSCITNGYLVDFILLLLLLMLLLLLSSVINHRFVSIYLGPSIIILLSLYTCTLPLLKTTVQSASHSTGTAIIEPSISLNLCPFCASIGSSGASYSCQVVTESIMFVLATPTLISSCCSSFPKYLCLLARIMLVAAESGWSCGMFYFILYFFDFGGEG